MSHPRAVAVDSSASRTKKIILPLQTRTRTKVLCFCKKCNGLLVDPRTRSKHATKYTSARININLEQEAGPTPLPEIIDPLPPLPPLPEIIDPLPDPLPDIIDPLSERNYSFLAKKVPIHESENFRKGKIGKISDLVLNNLLFDEEKNDSEDTEDSEGSKDDDYEDRDSDDFDDSEDSEDDDYEGRDSDDFEDDEDEEVNFASTDFGDVEPELPNINSNSNNTWIISL